MILNGIRSVLTKRAFRKVGVVSNTRYIPPNVAYALAAGEDHVVTAELEGTVVTLVTGGGTGDSQSDWLNLILFFEREELL